ncbi:MAG: sulfite oxidase [Thaumarchaeota archaeon]|nr:sulfite oxidase [Nitrososphaerota archaeon]
MAIVKNFIVGLVAGAIALTLSFLLRVFAGGVFVPELAAQTLFSLVPGELEAQAVETLGSLAKYLALTGATIVSLAAYGVIGVVSLGGRVRLGEKASNTVLRLSVSAYTVFLLIAVLLTRITEITTQLVAIEFLAAYLLLPHVAFGLAAQYVSNRFVTETNISSETPLTAETTIDQRRRSLIRLGSVGIFAAIALFLGLQSIAPKPIKSSANPASQPVTSPSQSVGIFADPRIAPIVASEVTSNDAFYRVDVNIITPTVDAKNWKLIVKGSVDNPMSLSYDDLRSLPAVEEYATLECISNSIGGDLISTARWKGVSLKTILDKAHVKPDATFIVFRCQDSYDVAIPLEKGLREATLLAYDMNGETLPRDHGYPLRAIIPGIYGMMNAKWITEIEVVNTVYSGFWQRRGWSGTAEYQTHSIIVFPGDNEITRRFGNAHSPRTIPNGRIPIAGIAFAGDRGIAKVEVSTDGGRTWEPAILKEPLSKYTWILWAYEWSPPAKGEYRLAVRATDKTGHIQISEINDSFPDGATGYHLTSARVEEQA